MRNRVLRTQTASDVASGVLNVEYVAGPRGYVWIGIGTKAIGFTTLNALRRFIASAEKAQVAAGYRHVR